MSVLEIRNLTHSYGSKLLYDEVSLDLYRGEHLGLVGQNGAGKSTLLTSIIGLNQPDGGKITWHPKAKIGYLDQHAEIDKSLTIDEYLREAFADLFEIEARLERNLAKLETAYSDKLLKKVLNDQELLAASNFEKIASRVGKVVKGLGLDAIGVERKLAELSGGQRAKVILAKLLLDEPTVLLLDEPTNFLDKEHVAWLTLYLKNYKQAFILISHDVGFLDEVTTHICHLEAGELKKYTGNYSAFLRQKEQQQDTQASIYKAQMREIAKTKDYIARNAARASTAAQAQSRVKKLKKLEKVLVKVPTKTIKPAFHFRSSVTPLGKVLYVENLGVGYGEAKLLPELNFSFGSGQKIVITGFNGIGKSTLLKTLVGEIPSLEGKFEFAYGTELGYFAQDLIWADGRINPLDLVSFRFPKMTQGEIRGMLARYAIKAEHVRQPVMSLSGGEQAKVKMCCLALAPCNLLILDEPTNHLDVLAKEALRDAIQEFAGTVILVSHEKEFYQDWVDEVLDIESLL